MDLYELSDVLRAQGPFVTVHVDSESAVEQARDKYELAWKNVLRELADLGVDEPTRDAVAAARGEHTEGMSRLIVATPGDATVRLAVSLAGPPRRPLVEVAPLPRLLPLVDELTTQVPHVVVLADRSGADVSAYYDSSHTAGEVTVKGHAPDIRKVPMGGWSHLRYQQRAENGWEANAREIVEAVVTLADRVDAQLIVAAGDEREVELVRKNLPQRLQGALLTVPGGRGEDGSGELVRRRVSDAVARRVADQVLDLLEDYAQERGQHKRAVDGVAAVVEALRKAQVQTLIVTTAATADTASTDRLWFGPDPTELGTQAEVAALGVAEPQQGALVDVLLRAALGTGADVRLVPHELDTAPAEGIGAILRYADPIPSGDTPDRAMPTTDDDTDETAK